jgi:hypothetical protein
MTFHVRTLVAAGLTALAAMPALAADGLRPVIGVAVTGGGETLATARYTDGSTQNIKSGGLVHLFGGFEYRSGALSMQANIGYHVDDTTANNGSVKFSRMPIEVLGFWHASDTVRLGGGFRRAGSAKLSGSGAASSVGNLTFTGKGGVVLQGDYFFGADNRASAYLRYVIEDYTLRGITVSGNHLGLGAAYRF